ncbi:hypothetical protein BD410DRAFT_805077 [Rickenella mellea]|uniref:Fungal-type protein kinase domain-containing protein n=1 Tax=Rickenella mellea TaxID=50990 RepID=A0A4Y7Q062_9AGAM|nr:hypothetical protein BD410DRAFT_805077 [Rickenella mellea]
MKLTTASFASKLAVMLFVAGQATAMPSTAALSLRRLSRRRPHQPEVVVMESECNVVIHLDVSPKMWTLVQCEDRRPNELLADNEIIPRLALKTFIELIAHCLWTHNAYTNMDSPAVNDLTIFW